MIFRAGGVQRSYAILPVSKGEEPGNKLTTSVHDTPTSQVLVSGLSKCTRLFTAGDPISSLDFDNHR